MNVNLLKQKLTEKSVTGEEVASAIGVDPSTYYRKMNAAGENFTIAQAKKLAAMLGLSKADAIAIFLE